MRMSLMPPTGLRCFQTTGRMEQIASVVDRFFFDSDTPAGQPFTISEITYTGPGQYVFLKIRRTGEHGDHDRAWTAPVWFEPSASTVSSAVRFLHIEMAETRVRKLYLKVGIP